MRRYFSEAARDKYQQAIEPALGQLATQLVEFARITVGDDVLDLGTGTGAAALEANHRAEFIVAVDFSASMVEVAQTVGISIAQADMHFLPFADASFDVALANFAFNSTAPHVALLEAARVLQSGSTLALHEWGPVDDISDYISEVVALYSVDDAPPELLAFRTEQEQPMAWDAIETLDDLVATVNSSDFQCQEADIVEIGVAFRSLEAFLDYKFAWPSRAQEFAAMPPEVQQLCMSEIWENLLPHCDNNGHFTWYPNVLRIRALST